MSLAPVANEQAFDCNSLAMDAARQVDEYREFLRNIASEALVLVLTDEGRQVDKCAAELRHVLQQANGRISVQQVVLTAPFTTFAIIKAIEHALGQKWLLLRPGQDHDSPPVAEPAGEGKLFLAYKRSTLRVLQAPGKKEQIAELISYCRDHFDYFILFAFRQQKVVRSLRFQRGEDGRRLGVELPHPELGLANDATFRIVCESKVPFFGKAGDLPLLREMGEPDPTGDCAIIPLGGKGDKTYLLFVAAPADQSVPAPLHYLEMISWQINAPQHDSPVRDAAPTAGPTATPPPDKATSAATMVAAVNELPPMPQVAAQVMELLSDPNSQMSDMVKVLSLDPALVARLIRVSNSALYGRGEQTTSLGQAVVRLGANTVRSLVMAASMKSLFPLDKTNVGVWGQALWQHSVECGLATRCVAQAVAYPDPEEAFVAGVLHDVGKVVILLHKTDEYRHILKRQAATKGNFATVEREVLGFDHTEVGTLLLDKWQMPGNLKACAQHHHQPAAAGQELPLVRIVAVGNYLSHAYGAQPDAALAEKSCNFAQACAKLNLTAERVQILEDEVGSCLEHRGLLD